MRASCLCLLACFAVLGWGVVSDGNASSHDVWRAWLAAEKHATQFARTRAELDAYEVACEQHAPALVALAQRHKALDRVLVVDARFQWDGLGDNLDRYAAMLRVGRALGRATFVLFDGCALRSPPPRWDAVDNGENTKCSFDPAALVHQLGGPTWHYSEVEAGLVAAALKGVPEVALRYRCLSAPSYTRCASASLLHDSNGSLVVAAQGEASAADVPWRTLRDDFADVPLLRLVLSDPDDLVPASMQPWVCQAAGHRPHDDCSLHCETFALWRPRARLWAAMRPALTRLDAWGGGAVGVVARTGAADHFDELPHALDPPGGVETASVLTARLAALFLPCRNSSALALRRRERRPGDAPCVTYDDDDRAEGRHAGASAEPTVASLSGCGPETEVATALASTAPGPLGLFLSCAARAAASLALRRSFAREAPLGHGGVPGAGDWGVLLFSDAPGLKCALEAGPASPRHAAVTPTVPGHTAYAPRRLHHRVLLAALADMYLLGLVDWDLPLTRSAFINAARQRRMLPALPPPPWARPNVPPPLSAGYERFFEAGRERSKGGAGVDFGVLSLLGRTNARCELTRAAVARAQLARLATAHPDELAADDHAAAAHE